jgi:hypothetical protein
LLYNSRMAELFDRISAWRDPRFVGEIAATLASSK